MSEPPNRLAIKNLSHAIGMRIWRERKFRNDLRPIGLWFWVAAVIDAIKKDSHWAYDIPNADTVKRRLNYLAEEGLWTSTYPETFDDLNPDLGRTQQQSCYLPSPEAFPEDAKLIEEALRRGRFAKKFGKAQIALA